MDVNPHNEKQYTRFDFTYVQGDRWEDTFTWRIKNISTSLYETVDLSGWSGRLQVRSSVDSSLVLLEATTDNGRLVFGGNTGQFSLQVDSADTNITPDLYVYDLEFTSPSGIPETKMRGTFTVEPQVTR